jgi:hypothetical protein
MLTLIGPFVANQQNIGTNKMLINVDLRSGINSQCQRDFTFNELKTTCFT